MKDKINLILTYIIIGLVSFYIGTGVYVNIKTARLSNIQLHLAFHELEEIGCKYIQINEAQDDQ